MDWSWLKPVVGVVADVGITAACTAVVPFGGELVGGYLGGAVNGLINGDSAEQAFSVDGALGMIGGGAGGMLARKVVAPGVEKLGTDGLKKLLGNTVLGDNQFGFAKAPGRLDVWGSALDLGGHAATIGPRSAFRGVGGAVISDIGSSKGRQALGVFGSNSTSSGSRPESTGTQSIAGNTALTWLPTPNATITGIEDHPGVSGTKGTLLIPTDHLKNAAMTSAYTQYTNVLTKAWEYAGNPTATPSATPPSPGT